MTLILADLKFH